ncbi:MAG: hypothetical protein ACLT98_04265 [Eggerthellaceae bacterium]
MASVLVYRGLVFWMPFLIGAVLIQRTKTFKRDDGKKGKPDKPVALPTASNDDAPDAAAGKSCDVAVRESRDAAVVEEPRDVAAEINEESIAAKKPVDDGGFRLSRKPRSATTNSTVSLRGAFERSQGGFIRKRVSR